jgi:hypothetical protein
VVVFVEPFGGVDTAPAVVRLRAVDVASRSRLEEFRLFEGELSDYHQGRIAARELPNTLVERSVPVVTWAEGADVVIAPAVLLASGRYSLASAEFGLLSEFSVDAELVPWLTRTWPPPEAPTGSGVQIFCGDAAGGVAGGAVLLAPAQREAEVVPGFAPDHAFGKECVTLLPAQPVPAGTLLLPPLLAGEVAFEPRPLFVSESSNVSSACAADERALGPACLRIEDDRIRLRSPGEASLWVTERPTPGWFVLGAGASTVVRGFRSGAATAFTARAFDTAGTAWQLEESITGLPAREHLIINEVLANPSGIEASSEWLELVNDGQLPIELSEFQLVDSGGAVALPAYSLAPGEFTLLAGPRYDPDPELDVLPVAGTVVLRLTALGTAGLSNSGELLRLQHRSGREVSRVPALSAPKPGVSLARRSLDAGNLASDFTPHAAPGASPGAPNTPVGK